MISRIFKCAICLSYFEGDLKSEPHRDKFPRCPNCGLNTPVMWEGSKTYEPKRQDDTKEQDSTIA